MIVSWNWLKQYVALDMTPAELAERLMMAGLNHEETHARSAAIWRSTWKSPATGPTAWATWASPAKSPCCWNRPLKLPPADPRRGSDAASASLAKVRVECPQLCPRYTARVIRGVKVGPSPAWLVDRLATVGIAAINNVVDITNYVLMECGQPLHAFDLAKLAGRQIIVRAGPRRARRSWRSTTRPTRSSPAMCVIADAERAGRRWAA